MNIRVECERCGDTLEIIREYNDGFDFGTTIVLTVEPHKCEEEKDDKIH